MESRDRTEAKCTYFGVCGGCKQQDLKYPAQTKYKEEQVRDIFERLGGFENFEMEPIVEAENTFFYHRHSARHYATGTTC